MQHIIGLKNIMKNLQQLMLIMAKYLCVTPTSPIPNLIIYNVLWKFHLPSCKMIMIRTSPQEPSSK
jgi:hypothetical protein